MTLLRSIGALTLTFTLGASAAYGQAPAGSAPAAGAAPASAPTPAKPAPAAAAPAAASAPSATGAAPAPTPGAPPSTGGPAPATTASADAGAYNVRLRALERNINELKERVFMTKTRLNLLKETVLGGVIGASRAVIKHKNEMGSQFRLVKAVYALDGVQIFSKQDEAAHLADTPEFDIYNGAIQPGSHTLSVNLVYQGNGFGVFSYLKDYKFNVKSSQTFVAGEGKATVINVIGYEKGGMATNMQDKPDVKFIVNLVAPDATGTAAARK